MSLISRKNAEHYTWGDLCDGWHLVKSQALSVIQEKVPPGCSEVRHLHEKAEQFFFILSGTASLEVDGTLFQIKAHQGVHVLPGIPHQLKNESDEDLVFIVTSTPPSHGDRKEAPWSGSTSRKSIPIEKG